MNLGHGFVKPESVFGMVRRREVVRERGVRAARRETRIEMAERVFPVARGAIDAKWPRVAL